MRVLIVDDSRFIREFLKEQLQQMGADCSEAWDGLEALQVLRVGGCFELMLIDVNMPQMNGLDCLKQLRAEELDPAMKIMMVTTEAEYNVIEQALEFGADEFLMKPFSPESLKEKLLLMGLAMAA